MGKELLLLFVMFASSLFVCFVFFFFFSKKLQPENSENTLCNNPLRST